MGPMNGSAPHAPCAPPLPVDLLERAIEHARQMLANHEIPIRDRLQVFWAVAKRARDFAVWDVHASQFLRLAQETGLATELGRHANEDLRHVIHWAWRAMNPFANGPLT